MADLSFLDKQKFEKLLILKPGYVLNFTDRTFQDFVSDSTKINIYQQKYEATGTSKANRLRAFWTQESDASVGKLLQGLVEYAEAQSLCDDKDLLSECLAIAQKLLQGTDSPEIDRPPSVEAHFEEIQQRIIEQIQTARFTIWIAVAWFTNPIIFNELVARNSEGVNIQLIIIDDEINKRSGLSYENEFETYRIPELGKSKNIMHSKFCVIDLDVVINGSYNWTRKAEFNNESISIVKNRQNAEKFAGQFIALKKNANLSYG